MTLIANNEEGHSIEDIGELEPHREPLRELGLETLEDLVYTAQAAAPELESYLGIASVDDLISSVPIAATSIPQSTLDIIRRASYSLGVDVDRVPRPSSASSTVASLELPPDVDLRANLPPVRHQGRRGTCVAHAALAAYEHYLHAAGAEHDLSEQFLYWNCKQSDGIPHSEGTYLGVAFPLLERDGCCLEETWSYNSEPIPGDEGGGSPPGGAKLEALSYRLRKCNELAPTSIPDIKAELSRGRCVAFSIPVFNSWLGSSLVALTGDITNPIPGAARSGGHAMCLVGYIDLPDKPALGGGRFILRNSWGTEWGIQSPYGAGYGTIPYSYIARLCVEAFSVA